MSLSDRNKQCLHITIAGFSLLVLAIFVLHGPIRSYLSGNSADLKILYAGTVAFVAGKNPYASLQITTPSTFVVLSPLAFLVGSPLD